MRLKSKGSHRTEHNVRRVSQVNNLRNGMLSDDSGNSSLSTYTSDSRKSVDKDGRRSEGEGGNKYRGNAK